jgi:hypothetical protein
MWQPNDQDDTAMDTEWSVGTCVMWAEHGTDEFDRPAPAQLLTVVGIGSSKKSYDYIVESKSGNRFYVRSWEIAACENENSERKVQ